MFELDNNNQQQTVVNRSMAAITGKSIKTVEEPELRDGLELYLEAFYDLDTERSHAMGWTRIPWHAIVNYAVFHGLNEEQTDRLVIYVKSMDAAHITRLEEKREAKRGSK